MKKNLLIAIFLIWTSSLLAMDFPKFSTAGFYELPNTGREVYSMNLAWRFIKGDVEGSPYATDFDDSGWEVVSIPHGLEYLPVEASGCANYQGIVWCRKRFTPDSRLKGKQLFIHFEAIMGKSKVYVNGRLLKEHYGGYLPVILDVTDVLDWEKENVIAVKADNSNDPLYPVGKPQNLLDFTYFGGIYRDCWLVAHNKVFITNANYENEVAGGGLFVSFAEVSERNATVNLKAHIRNNSEKNEQVTVIFNLKKKSGETVKQVSKKVSVRKGKAGYAVASIGVDSPLLWSPENPYLYDLDVMVTTDDGAVVDGYRQRVGIRSIEFKQTEGLWINGKPYDGKLMGTNRHQDFAILGNALPNSMQWRDAKKLRDAGMKVIRTHYVIDPAFMDACDELGLFALVEVPGWQFWNNEPVFGERVYSDIRNMIRIHRNHASLFFWEPVLNETRYPDEFAKKALDICKEEYPYPYSIAACDHGAAGDHYYSLLLRPIESDLRDDKTYFIREWGDNVDDWNAQNSDSRVARGWGEVPMLIQAEHYANPSYIKEHPILCYETICNKPKQIVGACFWHSFDHQRGYHADPFYGGIMDAFRQPKTSYYMFMAQRSPEKSDLIADNGPMIHIAHEITPFSPADVTVYSNCEEVRLTVFKGGKEYVYKKDPSHKGMPSPIVTFKDAYHFMEWKAMARAGKQDDAYLLAEGLIGGKVVVSHKRYPSGQADHLIVRLDDEHVSLKADGSDVVTVIAEVVDKRGTVKRLNNSHVRFDIQGEGRLLGDASVGANPVPVIWGSAPVLVQSTTKPGKVRIIASMQNPGQSRPLEGVLEFETVANDQKEIFSQEELLIGGKSRSKMKSVVNKNDLERENERLRKELNQLKVREVEKQQTQFGVGIND
ncbi:sugar-binding domain-containing protein [Parabacteroides hominis]|uniref:Glycoside hydrolase family 2 protein n=1 Tax=Parabacteroides hominis TaxID=2763057 RepID=A0ABR7DM84_9BACT|nr:sugar-binding domain-containing protein [Parabacteroides hominis]MBC5632552.1 glycoside hydrolase family 2 protein [Parabacteroides hominis]